MQKIVALLCLGLSTTALSSPYRTYIVNQEKTEWNQKFLVDYTVCSDVLENNPTCTEHEEAYIHENAPTEFELKTEKEVLYIWSASVRKYGSTTTVDYSRRVDSKNGSVLTSDCAVKSGKIIALSTFDTIYFVACQKVVIGARDMDREYASEK